MVSSRREISLDRSLAKLGFIVQQVPLRLKRTTLRCSMDTSEYFLSHSTLFHQYAYVVMVVRFIICLVHLHPPLHTLKYFKGYR